MGILSHSLLRFRPLLGSLKRQQWALTKQMKAEKRRRKALTRRAEHLTKDELFEVLAFRMTGPHANRYLSELAAARASDGASSETPKTAAAASDAALKRRADDALRGRAAALLPAFLPRVHRLEAPVPRGRRPNRPRLN